MARDPLIPIPVVYMGGCCGDLLSSLIDWKDSKFNIGLRKMVLPEQRQRLKKHHLFLDDTEKDKWLLGIRSQYESVPSHDLDYHVRRGHWFIGISVRDPDRALWTAERFKGVHRTSVWQELENLLGISRWEEYAQVILDYSNLIRARTDNIVYLDDIVAGKGLDNLREILPDFKITKDTVNAYRNWQNMIHGKILS